VVERRIKRPRRHTRHLPRRWPAAGQWQHDRGDQGTALERDAASQRLRAFRTAFHFMSPPSQTCRDSGRPNSPTWAPPRSGRRSCAWRPAAARNADSAGRQQSQPRRASVHSTSISFASPTRTHRASPHRAGRASISTPSIPEPAPLRLLATVTTALMILRRRVIAAISFRRTIGCASRLDRARDSLFRLADSGKCQVCREVARRFAWKI